MTTQTLHTLLDKVYELEGLLQLAIDRDDTPDRIYQLIDAKIRSLAENAGSGRTAAGEEKKEEVSVRAPQPEAMVEAENLMDEAWDEEEDTEAQGVSPVASGQSESPQREPLKRRFSLNDRFRFSRELFGGDARRFDDTLYILDSMATFSEAEEYLTATLGFDPEDDDIAAEFIDMVRLNY